MKEHVALYREYRPKTFDDVIGQDHIVRILRNQIKNSNLSHAYLFTGTRGTGKTTVAKIFAMSVNCKNTKQGSPCYKCEVCKELAVPNMDIYELDAASNNGVDQIREILDTVQFMPTSGKYKVYIIDEAHMLSVPAFNALLKTLEEPPKHVIFILATTEAHKIPQTILSRCMRFDFKLVHAKLIVSKLESILKDLNKEYEVEALRLIAEIGQGSVRDSLTIADTVVAFCDNKITYNDTMEILSVNTPETIIKLIEDMLKQDYSAILSSYKKIIAEGKNVQILLNDLIKCLSNLIYVKNCRDAQLELLLTEKVYAKLIELSTQYDNSKIITLMDKLSLADNLLKTSRIPELVLESTLIVATNSLSMFETQNFTGIDKTILNKIKELETKIAKGIKVENEDSEKYSLPKKYRAENLIAEILEKLRQRKDPKFSDFTAVRPESYVENDILHLIFSSEVYYKSFDVKDFKLNVISMLREKFPSITGVVIEYMQMDDKKLAEAQDRVVALFDKEIIDVK